MTIIDTNNLVSGIELNADVCIVGAGAAGITLATQFDGSATRVCVLESGDYKQAEEVQSLYDLDSVGHPIRENFMSRVRYFGGSCNLWAGRVMRMTALDFERRAWVANSGWPIAYEEIVPYYRRAEELLKLPAAARFEKLNELPGIDPREQALFARGNIEPVLVQWGIKPMRFGKVYKSMLRRSRNIDLYLNANVIELHAAANGESINHVKVRTLAGSHLTVKARTFVLACGGLENTRLLLISRSRHANGIGNERDLVGRYYLDHPRMIFGRIRLKHPISLPYLTGLPIADGKVQFGIGLSEQEQRDAGLVNSYVSLEPQLSKLAVKQYGHSVNVMKVLLRKGHAGGRFQFRKVDTSDVRDLIYFLTPKEIMPHFLYRPYAMLKRAVRKNISASHLTVINYCEQVPDLNSRVTLSAKRDALDMNTLKLDWRIGSEERRSVEHLHSVLAERVAEVGIGQMEKDSEAAAWDSFTDASHHMGTIRMSADPASGVVDPDCRVRGQSNLFISGSAVFPTAGHANPTLTIVALALRLADHINGQDS